METALVNKIANSGLIVIDLEEFFPTEQVAVFDLKDYLKMGLVLIEKEFREAVKQHDWHQYQSKVLLVYCSSDAIIPVWAYMLVATAAQPFASKVFLGTQEEFYKTYFYDVLQHLDVTPYQGQRLIIKGCSKQPVPASAYLEITNKLLPVAQSIMYGEPCSTVPVFKKK
ncbi:MAG: DUF2480 family protein [Saprospiraceae bacterium]|nr:DUF2480 family protein [Saprospiraceae bacterium]MBP7699742.1 DUF2480 family protein [Saprospiraceae bacterium]